MHVVKPSSNPAKPPRPLASAVAELSLVGRSQIYLGVPFWLIGVVVEPWARALLVAPAAGLLAAIGLYRFTYTRVVNEGIALAQTAPTLERESALTTRGRAALLVVAITPVVLLGAASNVLALVGAAILFNGVALRVAGRRVRRWETETGNSLLRQPRRRKERGDHGFLDARDFYVLPAGRV